MSVTVWPRSLVAIAISGYQRWLSPHKGYCCAHRVLHRGESCSGYLKRVVLESGVRQAWRTLGPRFAACKAAALALSARSTRRQQAESGSNSWLDRCDPCVLGEAAACHALEVEACSCF